MKNIFFSYAREDRHLVAPMAKNLEEAGFIVFFDQDIIGGQQWWDRLLTQIEECDVFAPVLSSLYLRSGPCRIEVSYAVELGKTLLPIDLSAGTLSNAAFIDPIKGAQWVSYRSDDPTSTFVSLVRAVNNAEAAPPLPEGRQRPAAPGADVLASAVRLVGSADQLTETEQWAVVGELRANLRGETGAAARALLESFLLRRDVLVSVYQDASSMIGELPQTAPPPPPSPAPSDEPAASAARSHEQAPTQDPQPESAPRLLQSQAPSPGSAQKPANYVVWSIIVGVFGAVVGFLVGSVFGVVALSYSKKVDRLWSDGDEDGARLSSRRARLWNIIGLVALTVYLVIFGALTA